MRGNYLGHVEQVTDDLVEMTHFVGSAMREASAALLEADLELAQHVIESDARVDVLASGVEEKTFDIIASKHPEGPELRALLGAMRMASSLERMGDLAQHVAKQARMRHPRPAVPAELRDVFMQMGNLAEEIVRRTGEVIATRDLSLGGDIARHDAEMDRLHRQLFSTVLAPTWELGVEAAIDVTLLSRYYERYADHAVSITRRVVTIVTGEAYVGVTLD